MSDTRFYHITTTGKMVQVGTWAKALAAAKKGGYAWLDYCAPTREELSELIRPLGLHPLAIEDCTDTNQIPKIDDYPRQSFMIFNAIHYGERTLWIYELDIFIGADYLITVQPRVEDGEPLLAGLEQQLGQEADAIRQGPAYLLRLLLDRVVDQKFVEIEKLEEEMIQAEESLLADASHFNPAVLLHLRRDLLTVRKSLYYEREILAKIIRRDCPFVPEKALYLYRDIYDHLSKFFELTESFRDVVTSLMEMYLSMLNNEMARAANDTNATVRRLTFITTIFMPLTLLASIGGMSEWTMMTGPQNWRISYPLLLLGMAVLAFATYRFLKWVEKRGRDRE